ncbi:uncharacterized protein LOC105391486 [Plutella xylostella]|uniref:uncharacterized protein LOC105391486 n=1 Tax=Plutella xylostella TaxID=51655 RepID=UPI00203279DA|nr:uncharacterized protein LOC105391486 [Plutella xylostella]
MTSRTIEEEGAGAEEVIPEQVLDKAPGMAEEAPKGAPDVPPEGAHAPAAPDDIPQEGAQAPAAPADMPQEGAHALAAPHDMPQEGAQAPAATADMPEEDAQAPVTTPDMPKEGAQAPSVPAEIPPEGAQAPAAPADMPQEGAQAPAAPPDMPKEGAEAPATPADMPEEGAQAPTAPADIPPEGAQAPAASADVPPEGAQAPAAPAKILPEAAQAPAQPENVVVTKTMREFPVTSEHYVQVTHINHPHSFFVRLPGQEELLAALSAPGEPLEGEVQPGAQVVVYSPQANTTVRGKVYLVDTEKETCDIYARDYGFTENNVPIKSLYKSPQATTPSLAKMCQLAHCQPIGDYWSDKSIEAMKYYLGKERTKIVVQAHWRDILLVDLYNNMCPDDVATMMALTGYTTLGALHRTLFVQPFPIPNMRCFKFRELEPGTKLHVRTLTGRTLRSFYVAEVSDYDKYVEEHEKFHSAVLTAAAALPAADMQKGEPVSVYTNDQSKYERAVITQVNYPVGRPFVWFVDAGGQAEARREDLKVLPDQWLERPAAALYCALPRDKAKDPALQELLQPGRQFHITIKSLGKLLEEPNIVSIDEVVEVLEEPNIVSIDEVVEVLEEPNIVSIDEEVEVLEEPNIVSIDEEVEVLEEPNIVSIDEEVEVLEEPNIVSIDEVVEVLEEPNIVSIDEVLEEPNIVSIDEVVEVKP